MWSHYRCSSAAKGEYVEASPRAHGYLEAIWGHTSHGKMLLVPHTDACVGRVDHLAYVTNPAARRVGPPLVPTASQVRRVDVQAARWVATYPR